MVSLTCVYYVRGCILTTVITTILLCRKLRRSILSLYNELECGPMPNVMAALPNIGAPCVQRLKVWLTPTTGVPCSNAARTRNPLKFAGVPQTTGPISAASGPKFTRLWGYVEEILTFFRLSILALVAKIYPDKVVRWRPDGKFLTIFFASCIFSEPRAARFRPAS